LDAVRLASKTTSGANSFTGTMSLQVTAKSGATASQNVSMTATMAEQLHPSLLAEVRIGTLQAAGSTLPGGLDEIVTPSTLYMKWSFLTQELRLTKPSTSRRCSRAPATCGRSAREPSTASR
jgi:hypothetical protein